MKNFTEPMPYVVYCDTGHILQHGERKGEVFVTRVGPARTIEDAKALIIKDRAAMGETFGGLIAPTDVSKRTYGIFRALGWEEVDLETI